MMSSAIATRLATSPSRYNVRVGTRRDRPAPSSEKVIAVIAWGRNMAPYAALESPYSDELVKIELAAGKVTSATPCTTPAR